MINISILFLIFLHLNEKNVDFEFNADYKDSIIVSENLNNTICLKPQFRVVFKNNYLKILNGSGEIYFATEILKVDIIEYCEPCELILDKEFDLEFKDNNGFWGKIKFTERSQFSSFNIEIPFFNYYGKIVRKESFRNSLTGY